MKQGKKLTWIWLFILPFLSSLHAQEDSIYGMVAFVSGEVFVHNSESRSQNAKLGMKIIPGDSIKTGNGQARIQVAEIYICHIEKNSSVTFKEILSTSNTESMNVYMGKGQIFSRLIPGKEKNARLIISTPTVTAGVRGTDFLVSADSTASVVEDTLPDGVFVSEGKVEVESNDGKFKVSVNSGEQATITPGELLKSVLAEAVSAKMKILDELKIMKEYNCKLIEQQKEKNRQLLEEFK